MDIEIILTVNGIQKNNQSLELLRQYAFDNNYTYYKESVEEINVKNNIILVTEIVIHFTHNNILNKISNLKCIKKNKDIFLNLIYDNESYECYFLSKNYEDFFFKNKSKRIRSYTDSDLTLRTTINNMFKGSTV